MKDRLKRKLNKFKSQSQCLGRKLSQPNNSAKIIELFVKDMEDNEDFFIYIKNDEPDLLDRPQPYVLPNRKVEMMTLEYLQNLKWINEIIEKNMNLLSVIASKKSEKE